MNGIRRNSDDVKDRKTMRSGEVRCLVNFVEQDEGRHVSDVLHVVDVEAVSCVSSR